MQRVRVPQTGVDQCGRLQAPFDGKAMGRRDKFRAETESEVSDALRVDVVRVAR
jgi:hypothetical protein